MQRVALINGKNKNKDFDLSKILESLATPWVVEGLDFHNGKITKGYAFVQVERLGKIFCVLFENWEDLPIDSTWTKKVFIEILHEKIIDGSTNNVDGTWIWFIKTAPNFPEKNFLKLWRFENWYFHSEKQLLTTREGLNITKQWNTFNGANQLLRLNESWKIEENNLPPMNIDINWLPEKNLESDQFLPVYDWSDRRNGKVSAKKIIDRLEKIEQKQNKVTVLSPNFNLESTKNELIINHNHSWVPDMINIYWDFVWSWKWWKQIWSSHLTNYENNTEEWFLYKKDRNFLKIKEVNATQIKFEYYYHNWTSSWYHNKYYNIWLMLIW